MNSVAGCFFGKCFESAQIIRFFLFIKTFLAVSTPKRLMFLCF